MKTFRILAITLLTLVGVNVSAATLPIQQQEFVTPNLLTNPGFENGTVGWTASAGATKTVNTTAKGVGNYGYDWDSNAAAQTLLSTAITIPTGYYGTNGLAYCKIKTPSGTATHTITVNDGTNDLVTARTLTSSSSMFALAPVSFIFPSSGTLKIKIASVASNEPEIYIDDCYLGQAANLASVSQAKFITDINWTAVTNCAWTRSVTTAETFADFGTDSDCSPTTTKGDMTAVSQLPHVTGTLDAGNYYVSAMTNSDGTGGARVLCRLVDDAGTLISAGAHEQPAATSEVQPLSLAGVVSYTTAASHTFKVQCSTGTNSTNVSLYANGGNRELRITVTKFPTATETAYRADVVPWRIDANIAGANPSLGSADVSSYAEITNSALTLTQNTGSAAVGIPCSTTNSQTVGSTTCAAGNESVGVTFNLPRAGTVRACTAFSHHISYANSSQGTMGVAFQLVATGNADQTISEEGKERVEFQGGRFAVTSGSATNISSPFRVCGTFTYASSGQKTLRLMYEQANDVNTPSSNEVWADAAGTVGQRDIHWDVSYIDQQVPNPVLVGSVSSNTPGKERIERATIGNSGGTWSVASQSGSWVNIDTDVGVGEVILGIVAGTFTSTPSCVCSAQTNSVGRICQLGNTVSTSQVKVDVTTDAGAGSDQGFDIICMGPQ